MRNVCTPYLRPRAPPTRGMMTMTEQQMPPRSLSALGGGLLITSVVVALIGGLFALEGLLGYFYNASMFWEGLDHMWEIFGGLAVAVLGIVVAAYLWWSR